MVIGSAYKVSIPQLFCGHVGVMDNMTLLKRCVAAAALAGKCHGMLHAFAS